MPDFHEELLQFIWRHRLLKPAPLYTHKGHEVLVLHPGELNTHAGPDFTNARIRLNNIELVGNIEIHSRSSDWLKHAHQHDRRYDKLILHVVYEHDCTLPQNENNHVEVLELKPLIDQKTLDTYRALSSEAYHLPCHTQLKTVNDLKFSAWLERMAIERLEAKVAYLEQLFEHFNHDYTQTFYTLLLRNFGFHVNAEPFELIAKHLPVHLLLKHSDNLLQLEALLLGIGGQLDDNMEDAHLQQLQREFDYLKIKYQLHPLKKELFKFSRLRPANAPQLRLTQLAMLVHLHPELFQAPQHYTTFATLKTKLMAKMNGFAPGADSAEGLVINTFAPFFFFYSKKLVKPEYSRMAMDFLAACRFERNAKTKLFGAKQALLKTASDSQALINLHDNYCRKKQCLKCGIAAALLKGN